MSRKTIVCFGPGPMFKGGIANYNTSLAKAFDILGDVDVHIVSWTQQYPAIIPRDFIDRKSKVDQLEGTNINVHYVTNYNNPASWGETARLIASLNPDKVVFQWAIAIQGLPLGRIASRLRKKTDAKIYFDLHFVIQKEGSALDNKLTKFAIRNADAYIVHAFKTADELISLFPKRKFEVIERGKPIMGKGIIIHKLFHPVYDMFSPDKDLDVGKIKKELGLNKHVFLFFGFIRKYKGLHNVIKAFNLITKQRDDVSLLIVGESFWNTLDSNKLVTKIKNLVFGLAKSALLKKQDDERNYNPLALIDELDLHDKVYIDNEFVPNEAVGKYFQVSDAIMLFYSYATPSGVESIGYNFKMPMLASRVGHFPETVKDGFNGYLAEAEDIVSMGQAMVKSIEEPIDRENVAETSREMSWENYAREILR